MRDHNLGELPAFIGSDQPTTCPKCGSRTEFVEHTSELQQHECKNCKYEFDLYFEED